MIIAAPPKYNLGWRVDFALSLRCYRGYWQVLGSLYIPLMSVVVAWATSGKHRAQRSRFYSYILDGM